MSKDSKEKATVTVLDTEYKSLIQTNIKDSLSSFVPDIPGEDPYISAHMCTITPKSLCGPAQLSLWARWCS